MVKKKKGEGKIEEGEWSWLGASNKTGRSERDIPNMSCLLAMIIPTELTMFIPHAPTSDIADAFFFASISSYAS
ncbi:hypothetical protein RIF29_35066 [Crotalaria pallida]|uniref:Uncharacterized protein n=1 Tax=Crotalaria pallida TaxID=3830 RepID=A0AAN9EAR6_CROPI